MAGGRRLAGDIPLRPSGYLRSSCRRLREPDGGYIIGPTADYALYVNNGTRPASSTRTGRGRCGTGDGAGVQQAHPPVGAENFIIVTRPCDIR